MTCPTTNALIALAIGDPTGTGRDHVARCPACAGRMNEIRATIARLETALAGSDRGHADGRARLLAALAAEPVPVRSTFRRIVMNRRNWVAAAATAAAAIVFLVYGGSPSIVLADALKPFKEAKSFSCEMVMLQDGKPAKEPMTVKLTWAAPGSIRTEVIAAGKPQAMIVAPRGKPRIVIDHRDRTYTKTDSKPGTQEEAVIRVIDGLAAYSGENQKSSGVDEIDGVKATRFDLTTGGGPEAKGAVWRFKVWVHPTTKRPIRVEFTPQAGQDPAAKGVVAIRLDKFEWDVKTDGLFDPALPPGYKSAVVTPAEAEALSDRRIVAALKAYRTAAGGYPKSDPFDAPAEAAELERLNKAKPDAEVVQGLVLIGVLQSASKETVYRGKTVGPDDKAKVLLRYKLDDGRYRVVFGDLRSEAVSSDRLNELEGK